MTAGFILLLSTALAPIAAVAGTDGSSVDPATVSTTGKAYELLLGSGLSFPLRSHASTGGDPRVLTYNLADGRLEFSLGIDEGVVLASRAFCMDLNPSTQGTAAPRLYARNIDNQVVIDSSLGQSLKFREASTRFETSLAASARCFAYVDGGKDGMVFSMLGGAVPEPRLFSDSFESIPGLTISFLSADTQASTPLRTVARRSEGEGNGEFRYRLRLSNKGTMNVDNISLQLLEMFNAEFFPARFDAALDDVEVECVSSGNGATCGQIFAKSEGPQPLRVRGIKLPARSHVDYFITRRIDADSDLGQRIMLDAGAATLQTYRGRTIFAAASHEITLVGEGTWISADNPPAGILVSDSLDESHHVVEVSAWDSEPEGHCLDGVSSCSTPLQGVQIQVDGLCQLEPASDLTSSCAPVDPGQVRFDSTAVTDADGIARFRIASEVASNLQVDFSVVDASLQGMNLTAVRADQLQTSTNLAFIPDQPDALQYLTVDTEAQAGDDLNVQIEVIDRFGNRVGCGPENEVSVTLSLLQVLSSNGPIWGYEGQAFDCGLISFDTVAINRTGSGYELRARANGFADIYSPPITIAAGQPDQLRFAVQPQETVAGQAISPAVTVHIEDAFGNLTDSAAAVELALVNDPSGAASLDGAGPLSASSGVISFPALSVDRSGSGFVIEATSTAAAPATSQPFDITASAPAGIQLSGPSNQTAGEVGDSFTLTVVDTFGNPTIVPFEYSFTLATDSTGSVSFDPATLTIAPGFGTASFTYSDTRAGTSTVTATYSSGVINLGSAVHPVTIDPAQAHRLTFVTQPSDATAGEPFPSAVAVGVEDEWNNAVDWDNATEVTLALVDSSAEPIALNGDSIVTVENGIASFANLSTTVAGTDHRLIASSGSLIGADSDPFDVASAAGTAIEFLSIPDQLVSGLALSPALQIRVIDNFGNTATDDTRNISLRISDGSSLQSLGTEAATNGIASYTAVIPSNWSGQGRVFEATASPLIIESDPVDVSIAAFTFNDFDTIIAGDTSQTSVGVDASASSDDLPGSTPIRYRMTLLDANDDGVEGFVFTYCADGPDCTVSETLPATDGAGQAFFGPEAGITAGDAGILDPGGATSTFEFALAPAGDYSLIVELLEVDSVDNSQLEWLGQGATSFTVSD